MIKDYYAYNPVAFDIETSDGKGSGSLDERKGHIALMQLKLPGEKPVLLDPLTSKKEREEIFNYVRGVVSDPRNIIIGHNLKFDYKWLAYNGIFIRNLFDTMVASELYYAGLRAPDGATKVTNRNTKIYKEKSELDPIFADYTDYLDFSVTGSSRFSHSFAACMLRELNIEISKAEQVSDWAQRPLTDSQIDYALWDVRETDKLAQVLYERLRSVGLDEVFWIEMDVEPAIAFKEMAGVKVDKEAWMEQTRELNEEIKQQKYDLEQELGMRLANERNDREGLFGIVPVAVNLNSPTMADHLGIPDTQASTLRENEDKDPFIPKFMGYKVRQKLASTYGKTYLKHIDDADSRMRGQFKQTKTATGRLASYNPNLQNVPPNHIKSLMRPSEGHHLVAIDFSTVELRILAYLSGDEKFIASCNGLDMHSENARLIYGIPADQPVPKESRRKAKVVSFSIPYGTSAWGLFARGITASVEEAQELIDNFYTTFPKVAEFLRQNAYDASIHGMTRDAVGRIRRYEVPGPPDNYETKKNIFKAIRGAIYDKEWDFREIVDMPYKEAIVKYEGLDMICTKDAFFTVKQINTYERRLSAIRREGQNHPIQATSASITKRAMADVYEYLRDTAYGFLTLSIHDSIFYELREDYFKYAFPDIITLMEDAGPKIVPDIKTPVDADFGYMVKQKCEAHGETVFMFNQVLDGDSPRTLDDMEIKAKVEGTCAKEH